VVGAGNGIVTQSKLILVCKGGTPVELLQEYGPQMQARGQVTSILINCTDVLVGSTMNEIYYARLGCLDGTKMLLSAHVSVVNDVAFPDGYSEAFASCNGEDIRIWNSAAMRELVRINVANMTCHTIIFTHNGSSIVSGWNDSHVRTYSVQSATPLWVIHHAHLRKYL
jgi:WD40 repeat protein